MYNRSWFLSLFSRCHRGHGLHGSARLSRRRRVGARAFRRILIRLLSVSIVYISAVSYASDEVAAMVRDADRYRLQSAAAKVISHVSVYQNGTQEKNREYHVYLRENRESLVLFKSSVEAGQKMLMLGDNYWLLMPKSRRPIRITPMQKLLGEASVGDISTLTWSDDYHAVADGTETITLPQGRTVATQRLQLTAKTPGASYQAITLWLAQGSHYPVKADLYLHSGKLAKQAWFAVEGERVCSMTLQDRIQNDKSTVIVYQAITPERLDDRFYNPAYLIQNGAGL